MAILYHNTKSNSDIIAINIFIEYQENIRGLTNLTTSMLGKKTTSKSSNDINEVFESVGGFLRFKTYSDFINVAITTKKHKLKESVDTILDVLLNPVFEQEALDVEKTHVLSILKSRKERPHDFAFDNLRKILFKDTPYEISSLGIEEIVSKISLEDINKNIKGILNNDFIISIVGDELEDELSLLKPIENIFSKSQKLKPFYCKPIDRNERFDIPRGGAQATIMCGYDCPFPTDKNKYFAFNILNTILGNGMSSILFKILREEKGYAYAVNSSISSNIYCSKMIAYIGTSIEKAEDAFKDLVDIIGNLKIDNDDIEFAKRKLIGNFSLEHQTRFSKSYTMGYYKLVGLGEDAFFNYSDIINLIKKEDVEEVYDKYVKNHKCVVVK